jgi:hypothetical protein
MRRNNFLPDMRSNTFGEYMFIWMVGGFSGLVFVVSVLAAFSFFLGFFISFFDPRELFITGETIGQARWLLLLFTFGSLAALGAASYLFEKVLKFANQPYRGY